MRRTILAGIAFLASLHAAQAQQTFPPGSRIGLAPPAGMVAAARFSGFENSAKGASILLTEMPPEAFSQLSAGLTNEQLQRQGMTVTGRENLKVGGKDGFLISGTQSNGQVRLRKWILGVADPTMTAFVVTQTTTDNYSEEEVKTALRSLVLRPALPVEDKMAALPFKVGDRGGFRVVGVFSGNSVLMTDGPLDAIKNAEQPIVVIASSLAPPPPPGDAREQFAKAILAATKGVNNLKLERAESFRLNGQDWHETVAEGVDAASGQKVVMVQTIRFAPKQYVRLLGIVRAENRDAFLPRMRKVSDGIATE